MYVHSDVVGLRDNETSVDKRVTGSYSSYSNRANNEFVGSTMQLYYIENFEHASKPFSAFMKNINTCEKVLKAMVIFLCIINL